MVDFFRRFFVDGFEPGDYQYGVVNILSLGFLACAIVFYTIRYRNLDAHAIFRRFRPLGAVCLSIFLLNRTLDVIAGSPFLDTFWPFYLCNINTMFLGLFLVLGIDKHTEFFLVSGCIGGISPFLWESGIFSDRFLTFNVLESILSHTLIVLVPAVLFFTKAWKLELRTMWRTILGLALVVFNSEVLQPAIFHRNADYMMFQRGMPFTIEGVPQWIIVSSLAFLLVTAFYMANMLYVGGIPLSKIIRA